MPVKRKGRKGGRSWYNKKYSALQLASKAMAAVKYIKGMINCEKKYIDTVTNGTAIDYGGVVANLSAISQGDTNSNRNGTSILAKDVYVQLYASCHGSAGATLLRVVIFVDKMCQGTLATPADILSQVSTNYAVLQPRNQNTLPRYQILADRRVTLSSDGNDVKSIKIYRKFMKHIRFTSTASTDEYSNQICMLLISNEQTNTPTVYGVQRVGFYDN